MDARGDYQKTTDIKFTKWSALITRPTSCRDFYKSKLTLILI